MDEFDDDVIAYLEEEDIDFTLGGLVGFVEIDRPRGILSKTDRNYLAGRKDYQHKQSELNRKQEIRQRVEHSLRDFAFLANYLEDKQKEKVFSNFEDDELEDLLSVILAFIYEGTGRDIDHLEEIIRTGLMSDIFYGTGETNITDVKSVSVDIDIEMEPDIDLVYDRLKQGKVLTPEEIGLLVRHGRLSTEELQDLDKSDPKKLPARLERHMNVIKELARESDDFELTDEYPPDQE